jgi:2-polyprenyl-3-methyl-5-hydroxy-6-metoxy-1,4-benzoquinol methylase
MTDLSEHYILATGGKDVKRLRLLHEVYGPGTEALFHRVGLRDGQRVVEIGCGSGNIACWVAQQIAPSGSVVAIDISRDQIEEARQQAQRRNLRNIEFQVNSPKSLGWFDSQALSREDQRSGRQSHWLGNDRSGPDVGRRPRSRNLDSAFD